jgi:hypothetical protein
MKGAWGKPGTNIRTVKGTTEGESSIKIGDTCNGNGEAE